MTIIGWLPLELKFANRSDHFLTNGNLINVERNIESMIWWRKIELSINNHLANQLRRHAMIPSLRQSPLAQPCTEACSHRKNLSNPPRRSATGT